MMTEEEAIALYRSGQEPTVNKLLELDARVEKLQKTLKTQDPENNPLTPSGMTPVYLKPAKGKRKGRAGRKKGHQGTARIRPETVDHFKEHSLDRCPGCQTPLKESTKLYKRDIEDIPPIEKPEVTEHTIYGYWCSKCKKVVFPTLIDA